MSVDSPLALYTTLFGWQFYGAIWDALVGSGIAFLPFLGLLIENVVETRSDGDLTEARPRVAVVRMETELLVMLFVVMVAAVPAEVTALGPTTVRWSPLPTVLEPTPLIDVDAHDTGDSVTYGKAGSGFECYPGSPHPGCTGADEVQVPVWWYLVQATSQGLNRAIIAQIPNVQNIRDVDAVARLLNIGDPALRAESSDFYTQCYIPARSTYDAEKPDLGTTPPQDTQWMGSRFYLSTYYPTIRSTEPVAGFPYLASRDTEWSPASPPPAGKPTCEQWWTGETGSVAGLRERLLEQVSTATTGITGGFIGVLSRATGGLLTSEEQEDIAIRKLLTNSPPRFSNMDFREGSQESSLGALGKNLSTEFGTWIAAPLFDVMTDTLLFGAPMVQPMLLMGLFALLPFAMIVSRYSLQFMVMGAVVLFAINFWTVLWYIAGWVDDQLIRSIWPDVGLIESMFFSETALGTTGLAKRAVLDMVTASMYFTLPLLFSSLMVWAGIRAATTVGSLAGLLSQGAVVRVASASQGIASRGGTMASSVAKGGFKAKK